MFHLDHLIDLGKNWGLSIEKARHDIEIAGSPERCNYRKVIEDTNSRLYIIENIFPDKVSHKNLIAQTLEYLHQQKLKTIQPYLRST